ncbi:MAG TPA: SAM-dependent methyltransferase, partial [Pedobacter sp.]
MSTKNINIKEPRITLVGAGPGDPELITMRGANALKGADVVLYDALVNEGVLDYANPAAIKVYVGKRSGEHSFGQEAINKLMI